MSFAQKLLATEQETSTENCILVSLELGSSINRLCGSSIAGCTA